MRVASQPACVFPAGDRCGEGVLWHDYERAVYWTDINRFLIHRFTIGDSCCRCWLFPEPVTALILTDRTDTLAVVLGSRIVLWNPQSDTYVEHGFRLPGWPTVRLNDASADPRGSLWAGSMRNNVAPDGSAFEAGGADGALYRIDPDGRATEWKRLIGISNTLAWSPDQTQFYFADSLANVIWAYSYDRSSGNISGERPFLRGFERGLPDGSAVDAEGYVWNCRFGGGCVIRVSPDGHVSEIIEMPTENVTNCTFGGIDRKTMYVTTASLGAPPNDRLAGSLFAFQTAVAGQPENCFHASRTCENS